MKSLSLTLSNTVHHCKHEIEWLELSNGSELMYAWHAKISRYRSLKYIVSELNYSQCLTACYQARH